MNAIFSALKRAAKWIILSTAIAIAWIAGSSILFGYGTPEWTYAAIVPILFLGLEAVAALLISMALPFIALWTFIVGTIGAGVYVGNTSSDRRRARFSVPGNLLSDDDSYGDRRDYSSRRRGAWQQ